MHAIGFDSDPERAQRFINDWLSAHSIADTTASLPLPLPRATITSHTRVALTDSVSFVGKWPASLGASNFTTRAIDGLDDLQVEMMWSGRCKAFRDNVVDAAMADYEGSSLSLVVVMPRLWKDFQWNVSTFSRAWLALQRAPELNFDLPRLRLRSVRDLEQPLQRVGISLSEPSLLQRMMDVTDQAPQLGSFVHQASFQMDALPMKQTLCANVD